MARSDAWVYAKPWKNWRRILRHRRQRVKRGFSGYDAWNLDTFLAQVIADSMAWLRENGHGYPAEEGMTEERWNEILTEIEVPLRAWAELKHDMDLDEEERWVVRCDHSLELFKRYFFSMWD